MGGEHEFEPAAEAPKRRLDLVGLLQDDGGAAAMKIGNGAAIDIAGGVDIIGARQLVARSVGQIELALPQIDAGDDAIDRVDR